MEQQLQNNQQYGYGDSQPQLPQENAPYSVVTLVMGILSLVTGCAGAGLILGILGVVFGKKGLTAFEAAPNRYKGKGMLNAGRIMSIIGIVLGAVGLVAIIVSLAAGVAYFSWLTDLIDF